MPLMRYWIKMTIFNIKKIPKLNWLIDSTEKNAAGIEDLLDKISQEE